MPANQRDSGDSKDKGTSFEVKYCSRFVSIILPCSSAAEAAYVPALSEKCLNTGR